VVIDVSDGPTPRQLANAGCGAQVTHMHRQCDVLYIVSRELAPCYECSAVPEPGGVVTALDLADPSYRSAISVARGGVEYEPVGSHRFLRNGWLGLDEFPRQIWSMVTVEGMSSPEMCPSWRESGVARGFARGLVLHVVPGRGDASERDCEGAKSGVLEI
jgi:hypothetical protein